MKDVRTDKTVSDSRLRLDDAIESFEKGNLRIGTVRDLFRLHMTTIAEARGEALGTMAG